MRYKAINFKAFMERAMARYVVSESDSPVIYSDPERRDLPSLSAFYRYSLCHIAWQLSIWAPKQKETRFAASGTRSHKASSRKSKRIPGLSQDEMDTVDAAREQEDELIMSIGMPRLLERKEYREKRLFYREAGEVLFTGKPDVVYVFDDDLNTALILDYKFGFLEVQPSSINLQLRGAAVMAWQKYGCQRVYTSIIQPRKANWYTPALYELSDLQAARAEIKELMVSIHSPDATANPSSEACRHCPAKLVCKAAYNPSTQISTRQKEAVIELGDRDLSAFGELAQQAEIIIKAAKEELKARVTSRPSDFPDWYLQPTGSNSSVEDPQAAYAKFQDLLSAKEFSDICKPSITGLTDLVRTITGMSKHAARIEVERRLGDLLCKKSKEPSLKHKQIWEMITTENGRLTE